MAKEKLRSKQLKKLGFPDGKVISVILNIMEKHFKKDSLEKKIEILEKILQSPNDFVNDEILKPIVIELTTETVESSGGYALNNDKKDFVTYGAKHIEEGAIQQMEMAMRLPITLAGALMPDAHQGYGLPIGGVLATDNAVIPYAVGMDIGCRMALSIFNMPENYLNRYKTNLKKILSENTRFGNDATFKTIMDDEVLERKEFSEIKILKNQRQTAVNQIGTSGSGNHFVEFGEVEIVSEINEFNLPVGKYVGVLSHSGSRHLGYEIAQFYTRLAMEKCKLPNEAKHLAWLDLNSEEGLEYWLAMNLAGDYASANHHQIHKRLAKALGEKPLALIENHHNFAWKETLPNGKQAIVHRKGATPAQKGLLGLIPGSMASFGYIVRGKGNEDSLNSCSHGAGRAMSRTKAIASFSKKEISQYLDKMNVELIGGGTDEAPLAYKDIHQVMKSQSELVETLGTFFPRIVRMDE